MKSLAHHLKQSEHQKEYYHLATKGTLASYPGHYFSGGVWPGDEAKGTPVTIGFLLSNSHRPIILQLTEKLGLRLISTICSNYGSPANLLVFSTEQPTERLLALGKILNMKHSVSLVITTHTK